MSEDDKDSPEATEPGEGYAEDCATEEEEMVVPTTLTGSSVYTASVAASSGTHGGSPGFTSGGWISPSYPTTATPSWGGTISTGTSGGAKMPARRKMVNLPPKFTNKVLVAVIDPDEEDEMKNVIWAAQLVPVNWEIRADGADGRLIVEFSLEDVHGNLEED